MKKIYLLGALGGLLFASCASDDVINPVATNPTESGDQAPMTFSIHKKNQSRDGATPNGLETQHLDFGVWAFKSATGNCAGGSDVTLDKDKKNDRLIMNNYLVGFHGKNGTTDYGYSVTGVTVDDNKWFYEGLGSGDGSSFVGVTDIQTSPATSANDHQYLKYWDDAYANTYFYAYAPYNSGVTFDIDNLTIKFPNNDIDWKYACYDRHTATDPTEVHTEVPLEFKSIGANIRFAFYEGIKGYKVDLIDFNDKTGDEKVAGVVAMMAKAPEGDVTTYASSTYEAGGTAAVKFNVNADGKLTEPTFNRSGSSTQTKFSYALTDFTRTQTVEGSTTNVASTELGTSTSDLLMGKEIAVIPQTTTGFTVNVSFKLIAEDTGEVINVKGARVFVPATAADWKPNTLYTYIFKITNAVKASTGTEPTLSVVPTTDKALYPIEFEDVTIENITEVTGEYDIH